MSLDERLQIVHQNGISFSNSCAHLGRTDVFGPHLFSFFSFPSIVFFPFSFVMGKSFFGSINKKEKETSGERSPTVSDVDSMSIKHAEPGTGSQFKEFIKTVISFTGDLSSLTCPAFFLNGLSLLEYG